ncbi:maleylpyruvate isomerase family mycothiol-dependent enzyme [Streptomyces sp. NPDC048590]|uniref:maleylpyruvate isomerase family mycothiol-dependent enzyme n=1 Tax=Streptomyces sp. NPDC048590 TaxID=3365574 RepID=UPI0037163DA1
MVGQDRQDTLPHGLADAIRATASDIAEILRGAPGTTGPVPRSQWNVGEAAAHLAQANELMADIAAGHSRSHGDGTPQSLAEANARALASFGERDAEPLAAMIVEQAEAYLGAAAERPSHETLMTPLGPMTRAVLGSYLLTHMLGHGYDLARALKRPHMVDRARAVLTLPFMTGVMPRVTDAKTTVGLTARYSVRLWGGDHFGVTFTDGRATVGSRVPERADCTISIEPATFLLMALGRCAPANAIARGRVYVWGRKPWIGPRFPTYFKAP